jgi:hypothetical protein
MPTIRAHPVPHPRRRHWRVLTGGSAGNEALTSVNAALLVALIALQLVTVLALDSMIEVHLFVGVVLLGPVALKLAGTGYRFARYYGGAREYREKGPPRMVLRLIAPVFVASTIGLFGTGVAMLLDGEAEGMLLDLHATSFWVWVACLAVHVLLNAREVLAYLRGEVIGPRLAGAQLRAALVMGSLLGGLLLALALLSKITGFEAGD